ncbi:MAG TPA: DJ-1/PfpI family protein [Pseudonocardia sp.]|jgi:putative intracellular protease/amidase|nr:DJ-1/PfpI family protein [Pseudonocardia sp.]
MQLAILLFDRFTTLDAVGPYEVLSRLPDTETVFVAERTGPVTNDVGHPTLVATKTLAEVPSPDLVLVPGGPGQAELMSDGPVHEWLRAADRTSTWTTSVCTGSLILAAAGLLTGRRATSHWALVNQLPGLGAIVADQRVVFDGKYVTAAGVSSGIDMALSLAGRIAGDDVAQMLQLGIEYDPEPPYRAGNPKTAPAELVELMRGNLRAVMSGAGTV